MIVVDSTVWIDFSRSVDNRQTRILRRLMGLGVILVGDLMLAGVLQGFPRRAAGAGRPRHPGAIRLRPGGRDAMSP